MARHGPIACSSVLHEAIFRLAILEHRCKVAWMHDGTGVSPMPREQVEYLVRFYPLEYQARWWNAELRRQVARDPRVLD